MPSEARHIRGVAAIAVIAACGGARPASPAPRNQGAPRAGAGGTLATTPVDPAAICDRMSELARDGCPSFAGYKLDRESCIADFRRSLEDRGEDARRATTTFGHCVIDKSGCDEIESCIDVELAGPDGGLRECGDRSTSAAVGRPRAEWDQRRGAVAQHYSDVRSSKTEPIEVCTIAAEMEWLTRVTCDDDSRPFESEDHAHAARVGNVGPGGACGSIIDLYEVPCPEATYQVYIDAYVCPLP